jgi:predicted N-acetyltransferase YhbS
VTEAAIREVRASDAAAVRALLTHAFGGPAEAALVLALRAAGDLVLELVATVGEEIVGHVAYARLPGAATGEAAGAVAPSSSSSSAKAEDPASSADRCGRKTDPPPSRRMTKEDAATGSPSPAAAAPFAGDEPRRAARIVVLAPLSVSTEWRRRGIGAALVRASLEELRTSGCDLVLVLGDPAYYGRFGFVPAAEFCLRTPYDGPHQQALPLTERGRTARGLRVTYPAAFAGLE